MRTVTRKTKRDFAGVTAGAKLLAYGSARGATAEFRLQRLLKELDEFDASADTDADLEIDDDYPGLRRRWQDDPFERE